MTAIGGGIGILQHVIDEGGGGQTTVVEQVEEGLPQRFGRMVEGDIVHRHPVHKHIAGRVVYQAFVVHVGGKGIQQQPQCILAIFQQFPMPRKAISIVHHQHPDHTVGGVEHFTLFHPQDVGGAADVKLRQPQVAVGCGVHHHFHVIVAGAGHGFAVEHTLHLKGLHTAFQRMFAYPEHLIQVLVGGNGVGAPLHGEVGFCHR